MLCGVGDELSESARQGEEISDGGADEGLLAFVKARRCMAGGGGDRPARQEPRSYGGDPCEYAPAQQYGEDECGAPDA